MSLNSSSTKLKNSNLNKSKSGLISSNQKDPIEIQDIAVTINSNIEEDGVLKNVIDPSDVILNESQRQFELNRQ